MLTYYILNVTLMLFLEISDSARILAVFPTPFKSHQMGFRPLIQELVKRGHEVTVITTDPAFSKENAPTNLTEIDIHDTSYKYYERFNLARGTVKVAFEISSYMFEKQLLSNEVQTIIKKKESYDLLFIEMCVRPALVFSYIFKVPVILISSFGGFLDIFESAGAATHPLFYPSPIRRRLYNLSLWDKVKELFIEYNHERNYEDLKIWEDKMLQSVLGTDVPPLQELKRNVDLFFLNTYWIWDSDRPVPPNVMYMGGLHLKPRKKLPKDLQERLNSSVGAIYMSFGTNVDPSTLPPEKIRIFTRVFSRLPYTVLWKWNGEKLPGHLKNILTSKWFPQSDLLHHPKVKLFITQGGLHSTYEAIDAGIPLLGIPMIGDQWYNVEKYVQFKIGIKVDYDTVSEESLKLTIETLINDPSYRCNIIKLRQIVNDQPQTALERAVWWTEYTLRHGGVKHLRTTAAFVSWTEYYEVELLFSVIFYLILSSIIVGYFINRHFFFGELL